MMSWVYPVSQVAQLLSAWKNLQSMVPGLEGLMASSTIAKSFIQDVLPSTAILIFMNLLPSIIGFLVSFEANVTHSESETSLLIKYFIFLLFAVLFNFTFKLDESLRLVLTQPATIIPVLAYYLPMVSNFFQNYVILSGLGILPMQCIAIGYGFSGMMKTFYDQALTFSFTIDNSFWILIRRPFARVPRDFHELKEPPRVSYGELYPHPMFVFTITVTYSAISPQILLWGLIYFAIGLFTFKFQLMNCK